MWPKPTSPRWSIARSSGPSGQLILSRTARAAFPLSSATARRRQLLEQEELRASAARLASAQTFGIILWWAFFGLDVFVVRTLGYGSIPFFLVVRLLATLVPVIGIALLRREPTISLRAITVIDLCEYSLYCAAIAVMCLRFRGIASPYGPGICLVLAHRTLTTNEAWTRGVLMNGVPAAMYPVVTLAAAMFDPAMARQLHESASLALFSINLSFIFGLAAILTVGGHIVWSLRREVIDARTVGRYKLKERIGAGSSGEVWRAHDVALRRDVALKMLRPDHMDDVAVARFEREVHATCGLAHPNTVRIFDFGVTEDGRWYYTMELLEGETVASLVKREGPLPPSRAISIMVQVARALGEAHEHGIVHRDVKPSNVFLAGGDREACTVKVLDFGIARVLRGDGDATLTSTGAIIGTPAYISPEAVTGEEVDARADVYGAGAALYFILSGRPPFEVEDRAAIGLLLAHANERAERPSAKLGARLPRDLEDVVMRCLEKDPRARYPDGSALASALLECASSTSSVARLLARRA